MDNLNGYKAFEPGMICKGKQYRENTDYEEEGGEICEKGMMHYCVNPFDVLNFYPLVNDSGKVSDFAAVKALEKPVEGDNGKFATRKLHIGVKLGLPGFVKACIDYLKEETIEKAPNSTGSSGDYAQIGSSGDYAKIESSGEDSVICSSGAESVVKAKLGNWITLAEWKYSDEKNRMVPQFVKTEFVDGEKIKADTWYKLIGGEFTEVSP
nr:MAG TPA_asm: hypothetical protein [Caudoviricetes sp.]